VKMPYLRPGSRRDVPQVTDPWKNPDVPDEGYGSQSPTPQSSNGSAEGSPEGSPKIKARAGISTNTKPGTWNAYGSQTTGTYVPTPLKGMTSSSRAQPVLMETEEAAPSYSSPPRSSGTDGIDNGMEVDAEPWLERMHRMRREDRALGTFTRFPCPEPDIEPAKPENCPFCEGSGFPSGLTLARPVGAFCQPCLGRGRVVKESPFAAYWNGRKQHCTRCYGSGREPWSTIVSSQRTAWTHCTRCFGSYYEPQNIPSFPQLNVNLSRLEGYQGHLMQQQQLIQAAEQKAQREEEERHLRAVEMKVQDHNRQIWLRHAAEIERNAFLEERRLEEVRITEKNASESVDKLKAEVSLVDTEVAEARITATVVEKAFNEQQTQARIALHTAILGEEAAHQLADIEMKNLNHKRQNAIAAYEGSVAETERLAVENGVPLDDLGAFALSAQQHTSAHHKGYEAARAAQVAASILLEQARADAHERMVEMQQSRQCDQGLGAAKRQDLEMEITRRETQWARQVAEWEMLLAKQQRVKAELQHAETELAVVMMRRERTVVDAGLAKAAYERLCSEVAVAGWR
jgi:hypothetical protein